MDFPYFAELVDDVVKDIKANLDPYRRAITDITDFIAWDEPTDYFLQATGTPKGYVLLGAYEDDVNRPQINIFRSSIENIAPTMGGIRPAIRNVLNHEIWQHLMGLDHTRETTAMGYSPSMIQSPNGDRFHVSGDMKAQNLSRQPCEYTELGCGVTIGMNRPAPQACNMCLAAAGLL